VPLRQVFYRKDGDCGSQDRHLSPGLPGCDCKWRRPPFPWDDTLGKENAFLSLFLLFFFLPGYDTASTVFLRKAYARIPGANGVFWRNGHCGRKDRQYLLWSAHYGIRKSLFFDDSQGRAFPGACPKAADIHHHGPYDRKGTPF